MRRNPGLKYGGKKIIWLGLFVLLCLGFGFLFIVKPVLTGKAAYYVGPNGSDSNPGTQNRPWKTIQKAADVMTAGDTAIVLAGSYSERVKVSQPGSAGLPITFQASGEVSMNGFTVMADYIAIKGFEITGTPDHDTDGRGIYVEGSYCDLEDNYIHYATRGGILLYAGPGNNAQTRNCTVKNNRLYRNSQNGIDVRGQDHLIEGNEIWGTIQNHPGWADRPDWVDADGIRFFGTGHTFRENYIHDISMSDPLNAGPHIDAFQTWDDAAGQVGKSCVFEKNRIVLNDMGTGFQLEGGVTNLVIRNNIVKAFRGVSAYMNEGSPHTKPANVMVYNNLFEGDLGYDASTYPEGVTLRDTAGGVVKNNLFIDQRGQTIYMESSNGIVYDYNLFYNSDGSTPLGDRQPHDLWGANPQLGSLENKDFDLKSNSPAIDSGELLSILADDYRGNARPQGKNMDIGPFEFHDNGWLQKLKDLFSSPFS